MGDLCAGGAATDGDAAELRFALTRVLGEDRAAGMEITLREPNRYVSSAASEIVKVSLADGKRLVLFCKHGLQQERPAWDWRGGLAYEARILGEVLPRLPARTPRFLGCAFVPATGRTWLFTGYVSDALRAGKIPGGAGIVRAAEWIGAFHRHSEALSASADLAFVHRTSSEDYLRSSRAEACTRVPWLVPLTDALTVAARGLAAGPLVLTHGEYYPANILVQGEDVRPVDWESAAFGAGEIDLAALTDRWPDELAATCQDAYARARWLDGTPPGFAGRLAAARLFLDLRWLSQCRDEQTDKRHRLLAKVRTRVEALGWS